MRKAIVFLSVFFVSLLVSNARAATPREIEAFKAANQEILSDLLDEMDALDAALGRIEKAVEGEKRYGAGGRNTDFFKAVEDLKSSLAALRSSLTSAQQTSNKLSGGGSDASNSAALDGEMQALSSTVAAAAKRLAGATAEEVAAAADAAADAAVARVASLADLISSTAEEVKSSYNETYMDEAKAIKEGLLKDTGFIFTGLSFANRIDEKIAAIRKFQVEKLSKKTASTGGKKSFAVNIKNNQPTVASGKFYIAGVVADKISGSKGVVPTKSGIDGIYFSVYNLLPGGTARLVFSGVPVGDVKGFYLGEEDAPPAAIAEPKDGTQVFESGNLPTQVREVDRAIRTSPIAPIRNLTPGGAGGLRF